MWGFDPPVIALEDGALLATLTTRQALPTRPNGAIWEYVYITATPNTVIGFGNGDLNLFSGGTNVIVAVGSEGQLLNIRGHSHYQQIAGNPAYVCPVGRQSGGGIEMRGAPQAGNGDLNSMTSLGTVAIPKNGSQPTKYLMLSVLGANGTTIAVGDSTVTSANDGQVHISEAGGPIILNVFGRTHISWSASSGGNLAICALAF